MKPQYLRSESYRAIQPQKSTSRTKQILLLELAGKRNGEIAEAMQMTESRVSIIRNCPMYKQQMVRLQQTLSNEVVDKASDKIVSDPVEAELKSSALEAAGMYKKLLRGGKTDFVKKAAADAILDRTGYKAYTSKTTVNVEVTEKMASRFEEALRLDPSKNERQAKVTITKEDTT